MDYNHPSFKKRNKVHKQNGKQMINKIYLPYVVGMLAVVVFAGYMFTSYYFGAIYPLDKSRTQLGIVMSSSDPQEIYSNLEEIKTNLPHKGNPVFIYPTMTTDFNRMQENLDRMILNAESLTWTPQDSSSYHVKLVEISNNSLVLRENIAEASLYAMFSVANLAFSSIMASAFVAILWAFKQKRNQINANR